MPVYWYRTACTTILHGVYIYWYIPSCRQSFEVLLALHVICPMIPLSFDILLDLYKVHSYQHLEIHCSDLIKKFCVWCIIMYVMKLHFHLDFLFKDPLQGSYNFRIFFIRREGGYYFINVLGILGYLLYQWIGFGMFALFIQFYLYGKGKGGQNLISCMK